VVLLLGWGWTRIDDGDPPPSPPAQAQPPPNALPGAAGDARAPSRLALPPEAGRTIALIRQGGPFPHHQDGGVFGNREGHLPRMPRGWYREYTVETPGLGHRGARRIVTGGDPPRDWYYTADHYASFRRFKPDADGDAR
jgi:guanyl-specific ribonuclease Sa